MRVDFKIDTLNPCICGFKPDHYSVGYGSTPYDIFCPTCKKQTARSKCLVTGWNGNLIDYWNKHLSNLTMEEIKQELLDFEKEKIEKDPYREYKVYEYYWIKDEGQVLFRK